MTRTQAKSARVSVRLRAGLAGVEAVEEEEQVLSRRCGRCHVV